MKTLRPWASLIIVLTLHLFSLEKSWAESFIRPRNYETPYVGVTRNNYPQFASLITESPNTSTGETSFENPLVVYSPIDLSNNTAIPTSNTDQTKRVGFNFNLLPMFDSEEGLLSLFQFHFKFSNDSADEKYIVAGARSSDGDYFVVDLFYNSELHYTATPAATQGDGAFYISLVDICTNITCKIDDSTISNSSEEIEFAFFLSSSKYSVGETISEEDRAVGLHYKLKISNIVPSGTLTLNSLTKGDERVYISFSGGEDVSQMGAGIYQRTYAFVLNTVSPISAGSHYIDLSAIISLQEELPGNPKSGEVIFKDLVNGQSYNITVALMNKYQFMSSFSNSEIQIPEDIASILEKNACYIASAGFQEDHFILTSLRYVRDHVLLQFPLGRSFVRFYYANSLEYAQKILKSKTLQTLTKTFLFFFFFTVLMIHLFVIYRVLFWITSFIRIYISVWRKKNYGRP